MTNPKSVIEIEEEIDEDPTIQGYVRSIIRKEGVFASPIDINIATTHIIETPLLEWHNFENRPKKMKITNSGHTVIISAKWFEERPYIDGGPLKDKYVFSQIHFHWGVNDMEGSEHTTDGIKHSAELHVVMFKSSYLTQEAALKEEDGIVILVYFIRLQGGENPVFQYLMDALPNIQQANTSFKITPIPLSKIVKPFESDFFCYWGSVVTAECTHFVLWLIGRTPIGVSYEQVNYLRMLYDSNKQPLKKNCRKLQPVQNRTIFHVNPSGSKYATLKPFDKEEDL